MEKRMCDFLNSQLTCPECGECDGIEANGDIQIGINNNDGNLTIERVIPDYYDFRVRCRVCGYEFGSLEAVKLGAIIYDSINVDKNLFYELFDINLS